MSLKSPGSGIGEDIETTVGDGLRHELVGAVVGRHVVLGCVPEQAPKGDDGGETGEVDEEVGSNALQGYSVLKEGVFSYF